MVSTETFQISNHRRRHTQQVPHLQFHILNQSTNVGNVACIRVNRQVHFHLAGHVAAKIHLTQALVSVGQMKDDGTGELVMGHACPIGGFEDVDTVPFP